MGEATTAAGLTVSQAMAWWPVWMHDKFRGQAGPARQWLESMWAGREALGGAEILALPLGDWPRLNLILNANTIGRAALAGALAAIARSADGWDDDPRSAAAVETAERYARGEATDEELAEAASRAHAAYGEAREAVSLAYHAASKANEMALWPESGEEKIRTMFAREAALGAAELLGSDVVVLAANARGQGEEEDARASYFAFALGIVAGYLIERGPG